MKATVRLQYWRIASVYGLIGVIVAWQWHFISTGVESNPYLNLLIIAVFAFGSLKLVVSLMQLRKEGVAFEALEELWADVQSDRAGGEVRLARYERAFEPGLIYRRPKLLGHIFELTLEELMRTRQMRISVSTMQNLMHAVDGRIAMERSLVSYLAGTLHLPRPHRHLHRPDGNGAVGGRHHRHGRRRLLRQRQPHGDRAAAHQFAAGPPERHGDGILLLALRPLRLAGPGAHGEVRQPGHGRAA